MGDEDVGDEDDVVGPVVPAGALGDVEPWKSTIVSLRSTVWPALTTRALEVTV